LIRVTNESDESSSAPYWHGWSNYFDGGNFEVFIRRKVVRGINYYALVESERGKDGHVRQHTIFSLGRDATFEAAIKRQFTKIAFYRQKGTGEELISESQRRIKLLSKALRDWKNDVRDKL
jgi:hypothetical protein